MLVRKIDKSKVNVKKAPSGRELTPKAAEGLFCDAILLFTILPPLRGPPPFAQGRMAVTVAHLIEMM